MKRIIILNLIILGNIIKEKFKVMYRFEKKIEKQIKNIINHGIQEVKDVFK